MTEDEVIFALAAVEREMDTVKRQMLVTTSTLRKVDGIIGQQKDLLDSLDASLSSMLSARVVSFSEFRSVTTGRNRVEKDLRVMRGQRKEAERLLAVIIGREAEFTTRRQQLLQHQLDNPPQVVLEFKR